MDLPLKAGKIIKQQYTIPCLLEQPNFRILITPNAGKDAEKEKGTLVQCFWECKSVHTSGKKSMVVFLKK